MKWKILESQKLLSSRWVQVKKDKVHLPNGQIVDDFYAIIIADAVAIIAIDCDNKLVIKSEHRYCYD